MQGLRHGTALGFVVNERTSSHRVKPPLLKALRESAGEGDLLSFAAFMQACLYTPGVGYYARAGRERVGRASGTDFYTATTTGSLFARLVAEAAANLLGGGSTAHTFVEIGAEPGRSLWDVLPEEARARFAGGTVLRLGDALEIPAKAIVFSNELFDAQPFHRLRRSASGWTETGVRVDAEGFLQETDLPEVSPEVHAACPQLDAIDVPEGWRLDLPTGADSLLQTITAGNWQGLFLAFDYGKSWDELTTATPEGTLRAYHRHTQSNDLLARPGEQDLTGHVCWDCLLTLLAKAGFTTGGPLRQEAFFVRHAPQTLEAVLTARPGTFDTERLRLMELLHPAHMGGAFQAIHGRRP